MDDDEVLARLDRDERRVDDLVAPAHRGDELAVLVRRRELAAVGRVRAPYRVGRGELQDALEPSRRYASHIFTYTYRSNWIQQDSTVNIDYDPFGAALKTKQVFYYGTPSNIQPVKNETYSSTGDVLTSEMKYPTDYIIAPYTTMISKNIISPVVETKQKRNATDINLIRSNYKEWYNTSASYIAGPETIVAKKGSYAEETRIRYYAYDNTGNPLEIAKENGARISYIWDYNKGFPVAEIKNAGITTDSIAYTSFEADGKGYWQFSGAPISETFQPTGYYCYNLNNGKIDPIAVIEIQRIISFLKERGIGVLITDHNVRETLGICDHAYIISDGHVLAQGTPSEIVDNADVRRVYLGEHFRM